MIANMKNRNQIKSWLLRTTLITILLGIATSLSANDKFYISDFSIKAGETKELAIQFESDNVNSSDPSMLNYVAFQFDLYLPEGLTVVQKKGKYSFTFNADRYDDHTFSSALQNDGAIRVLAASLSNANFWETSGDFVYFSVTADADFSGNQEIALKNIMFSTATGRTNLTDSKTNVTTSSAEPSNDKLYITDFSIKAGETKELAIQFESDNVSSSDPSMLNYVAFQFDLYLPEGLTVVEKKGKYNFTFNEDRHDDHTFSSALQNDGAIRVLAASLSNSNFWETSGDFVYFFVTADADFSGNQEIALKNIMFSTTTGRTSIKDAITEVTGLPKDIDVTNITLDKTALELTEGETATLTATITPSDATDKTVTWATSDESIATVDNGVITAISEGTATITAKAGNYTATCTITVNMKVVEVTGITLDKEIITLLEGETMVLSATIFPINTTDRKITWTSTNKDIAYVNIRGRITAVSAGTTFITAQAGNYIDTCVVIVKKMGVIDVTGITLNTNIATLAEGETCTLIATLTPSDATDKTITWTSDNISVATVNEGVVTAIVPGTATITAKAGNYTATCTIKVNKKVIDVTAITLDKTAIELTEGEIATLTATIAPSDATDKTVTWTTSDKSVATVDNGVVTAISAGTTTITAKAGEYKATCTITVNKKVIDVTAITLDKTALELTEGETSTLIATVSPNNATDKTITWTTSDKSIATVDNGIVTAISAGTTTITAKVGNFTTTCTVTVKKPFIEVTGITLDKSTVLLTEGGSTTLTATILPSDATDKNVEWTSSDTNKAIVDDGVVTAISAGIVTITAKAGEFTATCKVTVKKKSVAVSGIELDIAIVELTEGESTTLSATVTPSDATNKSVTWTTSDENIAIVDNGVVTAVSAGTATITAKAGNYTATCTIIIKALSIEVTQADERIWPADIYDLSGRMIKKNSTSLENLDKGIYFIKGHKVVVK